MGMIKGQVQYEKWESGKKLTRGEAIKAKCYDCNGFEESNVDCGGESCPLYQFHQYRGKKKKR